MQMTCENCYTLYDIPENKRGLAACPYCEHVNKPKKQPTSPPEQGGLGIDPSKTMLAFIGGDTKNEGSAVQKLINGRVPSLPADRSYLLTLVEGEEKGKSFLLEKPVIRIGRKEADLSLRDPEISRQHCVIQIYGETLILRDLKSANGTLVNDFLVREAVLKDRDQIRLGQSVLQLSIRKNDRPRSG